MKKEYLEKKLKDINNSLEQIKLINFQLIGKKTLLEELIKYIEENNNGNT
jgi:hypothetical protein